MSLDQSLGGRVGVMDILRGERRQIFLKFYSRFVKILRGPKQNLNVIFWPKKSKYSSKSPFSQKKIQKIGR
jgi:hypothetical protein